MPTPIYLDHAATTPVAPEAVATMMAYFSEEYGNPSSVHRYGQRAEAAVTRARQSIAALLHCALDEIVFTSGGSEADNLALRGVMFAARQAGGGNHLITSAVEHDAVLRTAYQLRDVFGFELTVLPVDAFGCVSPADVAAAIRPETVLVSVMYANNEIGSIQPIADIAAAAHAHGVLVHTDAVQAGSQLPIDVRTLGVDLMSLGAHKFYGPKGIGLLYARAGVALAPTQTGGSHERGQRAGTHNVPYIAAMATALELTAQRREEDARRYAELRDRLIAGILNEVPDARLTGHPTARLPNNASFVFRNVDGNELLMRLDLEGIAASSGSACKTGDPEPSGVLLATGLDPEWALGSLRLTVGRGTTHEHIDRVLAILPGIVAAMRVIPSPQTSHSPALSAIRPRHLARRAGEEPGESEPL
ncbi:MAG: cysteine desulfurase family protein [Anaerolineales bacterium]